MYTVGVSTALPRPPGTQADESPDSQNPSLTEFSQFTYCHPPSARIVKIALYCKKQTISKKEDTRPNNQISSLFGPRFSLWSSSSYSITGFTCGRVRREGGRQDWLTAVWGRRGETEAGGRRGVPTHTHTHRQTGIEYGAAADRR